MSNSYVDPNAVMDIDRWNQQYVPSKGIPAGLDIFPDGTYDFSILEAALEQTDKRDTIFRIKIKAINPGPLCGTIGNATYWFKTQQNVDILGSDLVTLGFDADKWTAPNGRYFSRELANLIASGKLVGINFRAQKITSKGDQKDYHNLRINARLAASSQAAPAPYAPPAAQPATAPPVQREEIPF